jgi:hypothetical protein
MRTHSFSIAREIDRLSVEELEEQYNVELRADGTVFDLTENLKFPSLGDWIAFMDDDSDSNEYSFGNKTYYDDE